VICVIKDSGRTGRAEVTETALFAKVALLRVGYWKKTNKGIKKRILFHSIFDVHIVDKTALINSSQYAIIDDILRLDLF
jgi:hypothetical protein